MGVCRHDPSGRAEVVTVREEPTVLALRESDGRIEQVLDRRLEVEVLADALGVGQVDEMPRLFVDVREPERADGRDARTADVVEDAGAALRLLAVPVEREVDDERRLSGQRAR